MMVVALPAASARTKWLKWIRIVKQGGTSFVMPLPNGIVMDTNGMIRLNVVTVWKRQIPRAVTAILPVNCMFAKWTHGAAPIRGIHTVLDTPSNGVQ